jgi:hypothetical protein
MDVKDVFEMVNLVYNGNNNKKPSNGDYGSSPADKVEIVSIWIPSSSALNPNAPPKKRELVINDSFVGH